MSDRAKIRNRRVSGNDVQQQREVAGAIKIAREMALLPYARRVASQRTRPPRDGGRGRGDGEMVAEGIETETMFEGEQPIDEAEGIEAEIDTEGDGAGADDEEA
jgi:small subunit ribosomal protein S18